jgi:GT2 family glycosyltransferase/glycosyltransferase involved in cell wall biosynthesis
VRNFWEDIKKDKDRGFKYKNILVFFDFSVPIEETLGTLKKIFPHASFYTILHQGRPNLINPSAFFKKIFEYHTEMSLRAKLHLIRAIRQTTFDLAIYLGGKRDLRQLAIIYLSLSSTKKFIILKNAKQFNTEDIYLIDLIIRGIFRLGLWSIIVPIIWAVGVIFKLTSFLPPWVRRKSREESIPALKNPKEYPPVSVVIPNYNGKELLQECLPSVLSAAAIYHPESEVIVVDDASTDGSTQFLRDYFPKVKIISLSTNQGFVKACNKGVSSSKNRIVILLNSDIIVEEDFISYLVEYFSDSSIFAVQPKILTWDRESINAGINMGRMERGYIRIWNEAETRNTNIVDHRAPNLYAIGGAMAFDKEKWEFLGGFDDLYYPFCWEDIDISYRAWKMGWKVFYEPKSIVYHKHHGTLTKFFKADFKRVVEQRNELLFTWKNIHDQNLIKNHFQYLPYHLFSTLISGDFTFFKAVLWAIAKLGKVIHKRHQGQVQLICQDIPLLEKSLHYYRNFVRSGFREKKGKKQILLVSPFMPLPLNNGGKIRVYTLIKHLSSEYDFHLLCYTNHEEDAQYIPQLKEICKEVDIIYQGYTPLPYVYETLFPRYYRAFYTQEMREKLLEILKTRPIDLVQIEFTLMAHYVDFLKHVPTIFVEHDLSVISPHKSYNPKEKGWKRLLDYIDWLKAVRWEVKYCQKYRKIITVTKKDEELLRSYLPYADIETVYTGTDIEYFSSPYEEIHNKTLAFVGYMGHYPNVDAILFFYRDIYPLVKEKIPEVRLVIIGSNPPPEIVSLRNDPSITVTGFVEDIRPYIKEAAVFVAPMRIGAGIKGKLLEAMAMAKPIVTTSIGCLGLPVVIGEDLLVADSPKEFANKTILLLNNSNLREKLAINGQFLVNTKFDWQISVEKMRTIYRELISDWQEI